MATTPAGVQCRPHHRSPYAWILCLPAEYVNFLGTPLLDVVQSFSARSSSPHLFIHCSKHHLLHQPLSFILHMCPNKFSFLSTMCCTIFFLHHTSVVWRGMTLIAYTCTLQSFMHCPLKTQYLHNYVQPCVFLS